ncbi:MAG: M23 family metallopeptidase [Treponema sp.]|jgi:murein DD-endopeptidase MepM/ murein hydrolase activator NlpD|nr:M23 family metallopeptidase [Treponema sp.]
MAQMHYYKRFENNLVQKVRNGFSRVLGKIALFFKAVVRVMLRRYTIVLVPHSEKRVHNFHVSVISLCLFFVVFFALAGAFFWYSAFTGSTRGHLSLEDGRLKESEAYLEQLRSEIDQLSQSARSFEAVLSGTLTTLGSDPQAEITALSDRSSFFGQSPDSVLKEAEDVRQLAVYLASVVAPVKEIGDILNNQSGILADIPSIWPIRGGIGHFTTFFGMTPDPFTGAMHTHTGIDISTYRSGDPIVATADGIVSYVGNEPSGFGMYIIIRHQHGFYTRYAHLSAFRVEMGQQVKQGETIGYIGNTGRSTGPHLHYEVHIGSDVVDPYKYLDIRASPVRRGAR